ncbi:2TM domain-containing protein [Robertkochia sediminum]|uniref:2TM domain-containing protein n=1 Tax=Robertkochia sediminum TaxID=2785326 RepID=UPI0019330CF5|nr:2TM domain-containing protein [Robertkochia sediminum]MBL7472607.1 2TM domain-containing protein [Robertkochia sediminum]
MKDMDKDNRLLRAQERVQELRKFYTGIVTYLFVVGILAGLNYYTNEFRNPWFLWVAGFWGLGILFQAAKLFGFNLLFGKKWEERKIQEFMEEERRNGDRSTWE